MQSMSGIVEQLGLRNLNRHGLTINVAPNEERNRKTLNQSNSSLAKLILERRDITFVQSSVRPSQASTIQGGFASRDRR